MTTRIAMWSGPRNLSTALMRSFEARGDCAVQDEPLYGYYLRETGLAHPMAEEVMASLPTSWEAATDGLARDDAGGLPFAYHKQMAHHLLDEVGRDWLKAMRHAFLIRDPRAVVASYTRVRGAAVPRDLGFLQQVELLDYVTGTLGQPAVVVDSADLLRDPPGVLSALCAALDMPYTPAMLSWKPGRRSSDGVWAPRWYASVEASTGFGPPRDDVVEVAPEHRDVVEALWPAWELLSSKKLGSPVCGDD